MNTPASPFFWLDDVQRTAPRYQRVIADRLPWNRHLPCLPYPFVASRKLLSQYGGCSQPWQQAEPRSAGNFTTPQHAGKLRPVKPHGLGKYGDAEIPCSVEDCVAAKPRRIRNEPGEVEPRPAMALQVI